MLDFDKFIIERGKKINTILSVKLSLTEEMIT